MNWSGPAVPAQVTVINPNMSPLELQQTSRNCLAAAWATLPPSSFQGSERRSCCDIRHSTPNKHEVENSPVINKWSRSQLFPCRSQLATTPCVNWPLGINTLSRCGKSKNRRHSVTCWGKNKKQKGCVTPQHYETSGTRTCRIKTAKSRRVKELANEVLTPDAALIAIWLPFKLPNARSDQAFRSH